MWFYWGKVLVFGQKRLCSGKSGCIRGKVVIFGQSSCNRANFVACGQSGCILAKVVVFGKK